MLSDERVLPVIPVVPAPAGEAAHDPVWQRTVADYYDGKTAALIKKYGPGPRVHYHLGVFDQVPQPAAADPAGLRRRIVAAQERLVEVAAREWHADTHIAGRDVLDVGCGLGGGAIYWAQVHGARVTAVTTARTHLPLIDWFAGRAGVSDRVTPIHAEATRVPTDRRYDAAIALESSCYFDRPRWFAHLARLIRPGGQVCVEEVFRTRPGGTSLWNAYFHARAGTVQEYVAAARAAGFDLVGDADITRETARFWPESMAWISAVLRTEPAGPQAHRLRLSRSVHGRLHDEWKAGGLAVRLLRFEYRPWAGRFIDPGWAGSADCAFGAAWTPSDH